jgi:uncharacterized membrane protein
MATSKKKTPAKAKSTSSKAAKFHFSKKEAVSFGFETAKKNIIFFIGLFVVVVIISALRSLIQLRVALDKQFLIYIILYVLIFIINTIIGMGLIKISLEFVDKKKPELRDLFHTKNLVNFILASLIKGIIVLIGFILLIIPGIIFSIRLQFATYLIIDKNMSAVDAVKKSWEMTKGNAWNLFFFVIILVLLNILGAILLLVGLFITVPLTMIATTFVYRKLLLHSNSA